METGLIQINMLVTELRHFDTLHSRKNGEIEAKARGKGVNVEELCREGEEAGGGGVGPPSYLYAHPVPEPGFQRQPIQYTSIYGVSPRIFCSNGGQK